MEADSLVGQYERVRRMLVGLSLSVPVISMNETRLARIDEGSETHPELRTLCRELHARLEAVKFPDDHVQLAQAYESYAEACFFLRAASSGVKLVRTPGTGQHKQKRPDFMHENAAGSRLFFEIKALEIADPVIRHRELSERALENAAELDGRKKKTGFNVGNPTVVSPHREGSTATSRIAATITRIRGVVKPEQLALGPTVLIVDLGRLPPLAQGAEAVTPVFSREIHGVTCCVSGELWQIACGLPGEQVFIHPDFEGGSNLGGHQSERGVLHEFPDLAAITFVLHGWNGPLQFLTIQNTRLQREHPAGTITESEIAELLWKYSDFLNTTSNECAGKCAEHVF